MASTANNCESSTIYRTYVLTKSVPSAANVPSNCYTLPDTVEESNQATQDYIYCWGGFLKVYLLCNSSYGIQHQLWLKSCTLCQGSICMLAQIYFP